MRASLCEGAFFIYFCFVRHPPQGAWLNLFSAVDRHEASILGVGKGTSESPVGMAKKEDNKTKNKQLSSKHHAHQKVVGAPPPPPHPTPHTMRLALITNIVVGITTTVHRQNVSVPAIANTWGSDFARVHYFSERGDPRLGIVQVVNDPSKTRASAEEMAILKFLADTYHTHSAGRRPL